METRSWTFVDKSTWGEGPWWAEPDKVQWSDAGTGLPCLAVRGPLGNWCGYIGIAPGHPFYGLHYSRGCALRPEPCDEPFCAHTPEALLEAHGGLTFSAACVEDDADHGICHVPSPGEEAHVWWLGFDAGHAGDYMPVAQRYLSRPLSVGEHYRTLAYVQNQCAQLALQLDDREWEERLAAMR